MKIYSIKVKISIYILLIHLLLVSIFLITSYFRTKTDYQEKYENEAELILENVFSVFEDFFDDISSYLDLMEIEALALNEKGHFKSFLDSSNNIIEGNKRTYVFFENNKLISNNMEEIKNGYNPRERNWYKLAVDSDEAIWTKPYFDYKDAEIIITCSKAIYQDDKLIGVGAIDFSVAVLNSLLNKYEIGKSGFVTLLNENGIIVANRNDADIGQLYFTKNQTRILIHSNSGTIETEIDGKKYLSKYKRLDGYGLYLVSSMNTDEIKMNILRSLMSTLFIALIVVLGLSLFTYRLAIWIVNPIISMQSYMEKVAKGSLSIRSDIKTYREAEDLSNGFNNMIKKMEEKNNHIIKLAFYDPLTSLANRKKLVESLDETLSKKFRNDTEGALIYIDIDNFKSINDTLGHNVGDMVLKEIAHRLESVVSAIHLVSRVGGDEFVVLANDTYSIKDIYQLIHQILFVIRKKIVIEERIFKLSCSLGCALYPKHAKNTDELLKKADIAMYKAKLNGKDCYEMFDEELYKEVIYKNNVKEELKEAIENGKFDVFFQPQIDLKTNSTIGFEALARFSCAELGNVTPDIFIRVAEEFFLIVDIENIIIEKACVFAKEINMKVSINISVVHLLGNHFVKNIMDIIKKVNVSPDLIELEITETVMMETFDNNIIKINSLRDLGIKIHLDDFGTGYSSLNYLNMLPIDYVKIDRSFVQKIEESKKELAIVKSIIDLSHSIGMKVIAEGVETKRQLELLKSISCDSIQGYYIKKPSNKNDILKWLDGNALG